MKGKGTERINYNEMRNEWKHELIRTFPFLLSFVPLFPSSIGASVRGFISFKLM